MHGAIAAGSAITADAAAEVLGAGGNAVDAVVAGCFAMAAGEPTLTSLAGGGVLIHRDAESRAVTICDFFGDAPGRGLAATPELLDFPEVELDFGPARQAFCIGAAAAAVPGVIPGLCRALERWGALELADVVAPACRVLRQGVVIDPFQARAIKLLEPILLHTAEGRAQFGSPADPQRVLAAGERYAVPALADLLEAMGHRGWRAVYRDRLMPAMLRQFGPHAGGLLTEDDLDGFRAELRQPLAFAYRGDRISTNPLPGLGGEMVALMLDLLAEREVAELSHGSAAHVLALARAMQVSDEARNAEGLRGNRNRWIRRSAELEQVGRLDRVKAKSGGPPSTTHISVVDGEGNACAVTVSYGEGNGHMIADTGIMMNNLMGEADLHPQGFHRLPPGTRLSTMMSPTLIESVDGDLAVLGTGGANRIRTALVQVISNLIDFGMDAEQAIHAARIHFEDGVLNAEVHQRADGGAALEALGAERFVAFEQPNMFFGGVHLVSRAADGRLSGAGDPRRGGVLRIV